jgi:RsiW-degrading membrane proteinase PrsW (M82 family)
MDESKAPDSPAPSAAPPEASPGGNNPSDAAFQRTGFIEQALLGIKHLDYSAKIEYKNIRAKDKLSLWLLPLASFLAVCSTFVGDVTIRTIVFSMTTLVCMYYIAQRIGTVRTFTTRQAYLTWQMLIGTFLFGFTLALLVIDLKDVVLLMSIGQRTASPQ